MTAHEDHADVDEADLFMSAVGGSYHGRVRGFGCVLDPKLPKTTGRGRVTPAQSDLSEVTNIGSKRIFTDDVLVGMLNERDMRLAEERQERKREQERYNMLFTKLFSLVGQQNPAVQVSPTMQESSMLYFHSLPLLQLVFLWSFRHASLSFGCYSSIHMLRMRKDDQLIVYFYFLLTILQISIFLPISLPQLVQ